MKNANPHDTFRFAFNIWNGEQLSAFFRLSADYSLPVICQVSEKLVRSNVVQPVLFSKLKECLEGLLPAADVLLALDHARDFSALKSCIDAGWGLVMFDGSHLHMEENITRTAEIVSYAHAAGVLVEGEIGGIPGVEDDITGVADPVSLDDIRTFSETTNVDLFSTFVGTAHGIHGNTNNPKVNYPLVHSIVRELGLRFVVHGGSGLPDVELRKLFEAGCSKLNISTELKIAYLAACRRMGDLPLISYASTHILVLNALRELFLKKERAIGRIDVER